MSAKATSSSTFAPGYSEDLKLNVEDDTLTISAEKRRAAEGERALYPPRIRPRAVQRSFHLPETANTEGITAEYQNALTVIVRTEASRPRTREIGIA